MHYTWIPGSPKEKYKTHGNLITLANNTLPDITPLISGCNRLLLRQLNMTIKSAQCPYFLQRPIMHFRLTFPMHCYI